MLTFAVGIGVTLEITRSSGCRYVGGIGEAHEFSRGLGLKRAEVGPLGGTVGEPLSHRWAREDGNTQSDEDGKFVGEHRCDLTWHLALFGGCWEECVAGEVMRGNKTEKG